MRTICFAVILCCHFFGAISVQAEDQESHAEKTLLATLDQWEREFPNIKDTPDPGNQIMFGNEFMEKAISPKTLELYRKMIPVWSRRFAAIHHKDNALLALSRAPRAMQVDPDAAEEYQALAVEEWNTVFALAPEVKSKLIVVPEDYGLGEARTGEDWLKFAVKALSKPVAQQKAMNAPQVLVAKNLGDLKTASDAIKEIERAWPHPSPYGDYSAIAKHAYFLLGASPAPALKAAHDRIDRCVRAHSGVKEGIEEIDKCLAETYTPGKRSNFDAAVNKFKWALDSWGLKGTPESCGDTPE
ncbi:MAG: hypothetical protein AABY86_08480, partial [Bdellovibrionota bacterium]